MSSKCKSTAPTKAYVRIAKRTCGAMKRRLPKSSKVTIALDYEVEFFTNSDNFTSKLNSLEDLGLPNLPFK